VTVGYLVVNGKRTLDGLYVPGIRELLSFESIK
jgi:hypothetical protein